MSEARIPAAVRRRIAGEVRGALETPDRQVYADAARDLGTEWVKPPRGTPLTADYLLVKAIDRFASGEFNDEELYRIRCIAFYMIFGIGGEEWNQMGVAFGMSMGRPKGAGG